MVVRVILKVVHDKPSRLGLGYSWSWLSKVPAPCPSRVRPFPLPQIPRLPRHFCTGGFFLSPCAIVVAWPWIVALLAVPRGPSGSLGCQRWAAGPAFTRSGFFWMCPATSGPCVPSRVFCVHMAQHMQTWHGEPEETGLSLPWRCVRTDPLLMGLMLSYHWHACRLLSAFLHRH